MRLVDETTGTVGRDDELVNRVYRMGTDTVRVRVQRNFYDFQSTATAAILSRERGWVVIAEEPVVTWHHDTRGRELPLDHVADRLADRAYRILGEPEE